MRRHLYCPACGETARNTPPAGPFPRGIRIPRHSHHDGTPLCPTMAEGGYTPHWPLQTDLEIRTLRRGRFALPAHHQACRGPGATCALNVDEPHDICVALRHADIHLPFETPGFARSLDARHTDVLADWLHTHTGTYLELIPQEGREHAQRILTHSIEWLRWCAGHTGMHVRTHWPTT